MAYTKLNGQGRVAFSPGEFAALFGKSATWGYRQLYAGKVKSVTEYGRIMIPAAEVDRILDTAGSYNGLTAKTLKTKQKIKKLAPKLGGAWKVYLSRRSEQANKSKPQSKLAALSRLTAMGEGSAAGVKALSRIAKKSEANR